MVETKNLTIMFTDIKGFTSKTSLSSRQQLEKILDVHEQLLSPIFKKFRGTIIKTIGDAFLVTFHSPTDAVLCGMQVQKELTKYNDSVSESDRMEVRIAINSGEVAIKNNDVFGEPVNIAARLEGIAEAGDIYFTESVYLSMNKAEIPTAEVGYRHFKGIPEEIKVYKVLGDWVKKSFFSKDKLIIRGEHKQSKGWWCLTKKILKWLAIAFVILFIMGLISNNRQKNQAEEEQYKKVLAEIDQTIQDARQALESNNPQIVKEKIQHLRDISNQMKNPVEIESAISQLQQKFDERFAKFGMIKN